MLDLKDVFYFVQVVDRGGFTSASRSLGLPKSTLSHRIRELEGALGVTLLNRTSRRFGMTEVGTQFYHYAQTLLQTAEVAEEAVRQRATEPSGVIRMTTAVEIAQFALKDLIPIFLKKYPKVQIVEITTDALVDIVADGFDLALRGHTAPLQNSSLVQRAIARAPWYLFAGPGYLDARGAPATPEEIAQHDTISIARTSSSNLVLTGPNGRRCIVQTAPRFQSNNLVALKESACANLGIAALPGYICRDEIAAGKLKQILPRWIAADARVSALIPYKRGLLPAVRALVDFLASEIPRVTAFEPAPAEDMHAKASSKRST
ncbi:DNA-binding transcriptional LysR family regulator [Bradyrhizobium sp. USDA 4461]